MAVFDDRHARPGAATHLFGTGRQNQHVALRNDGAKVGVVEVDH